MKSALFLMAVAFLFPNPALAIKTASTTQTQQIQDLLDEAYRIQHQNMIGGKDLSINKLLKDARSISLTQQAKDSIAAQVISLEKARDLVRSKAIHLALAAYGVVPTDASGRPIMPNGPLQDPILGGRRSEWIAIARDNKPRPFLKSDGTVGILPKQVDKKTKLEPLAVTTTDGITTVLTSFFETKDRSGNLPSPAQLASLLIHEQRHFVQFTTPGVEKTLASERERDAHNADLGEQFAPSNPMGMSTIAAPGKLSEFDLCKGVKNGQANYYRALAKSQAYLKWFPPGVAQYLNDGEQAFSMPHIEEEREKIREGAQELDDQVRREAEERRSADEEAAATLSAAAQERQGSLDELARKACASPNSLQEGDMQRLLQWFPYENRNEGVLHHPLDEPTDELSRCAYDLIKELLDINGEHGNVDLGWVKDHARALSPFYRYPVDDLAAIADKACRGPDSIGDHELQSVAWFPKPNKLSLAAFVYPIDDPREQGYYRCKVELFGRMQELNDAGGRLTLDWVRENAHRLEQPNPPVPIPRQDTLRPQPPPPIPSPPPSDSPSSGGYIEDEPSRPERGGCAEPDPKTGIIGCPKKR